MRDDSFILLIKFTNGMLNADYIRKGNMTDVQFYELYCRLNDETARLNEVCEVEYCLSSYEIQNLRRRFHNDRTIHINEVDELRNCTFESYVGKIIDWYF